MSENYKVNLPKLGESIHSASIVQWFKKVGDPVKLDEPLLEVSTDKVNSEIPSPVSGVLQEILAHPDQELSVGEPLGVIKVGAVAAAAAGTHTPVHQAQPSQESGSSDMKDFFSPALLRLAREKNISFSELEKISGTGEGSRLTKRDLELYIEKKCAAPSSCPLAAQKTAHPETERVKMSGMRKAIAENMVKSFYQAPHATLITEVDVTDVMQKIQKEKEAFLAAHGAKLTITSFVIRAIVKALQEYPLLNASLEDDTIVMKKYVNLGIAVSVDQGLMVPVIKKCQTLDLPQIAKALSDLSVKARSGKLSPDDVKDGTITVTNFGMSGVQIGIPIIRFPEVAIIGMGAAFRKAVPLDDNTIVSRWMMNLCVTFDHRVLDGMYGCAFLGALKSHLEEKE
jgi:2-oxoglutarate dehydrogenase E2 component (dihydrolipoamide succinyltransferase)